MKVSYKFSVYKCFSLTLGSQKRFQSLPSRANTCIYASQERKKKEDFYSRSPSLSFFLGKQFSFLPSEE